METRRNITRLYKEKLNMLLDVTQTINEDTTVDALMQEFEILLKEDLGVGKILVFTLDEGKWHNILTCGVPTAQVESISVERDLAHITDIEGITLSENTLLESFDAVIPLYHKFKIIGYVVVGDDGSGSTLSPTLKNLKLIQIVSNIIVVFIENRKMQQKLLKQESLQRELELAAQIQSGLVPSGHNLLQTPFAEVRTLYLPHSEVGGDYYDVLRLGRNTIGLCIADVSGKGISAALLMSNFQALVRGLFTSGIGMKKLIRKLNDRVNRNMPDEKFITLFIARYNVLTGHMAYVNAGHMPPIMCRGNEKELTMLDKGSIGLGMLDEIPNIEVGLVKVKNGTRLVAYTDGLVEIKHGTEIINSIERLKQIMQETNNIDDTMRKVEQMADNERHKEQTFDDISVLGIEFKKSGIGNLFR